ncbi:MAG: BatD family protein [Sedimentisphaerales bacterium]|nr:BatD family protein [Sedimentisphaerales bacterium]
MKRTILLFMVIFVSCIATAVRAESIRVIAGAQKEIYLQETFQYYIVIDGYAGAGQVDITNLESFSPRYQGGRDRSSRSSITINGRKTVREEKKYLMVYQLTARQAGRAILPGVTVKIDGYSYQTNPVTINVLKPMTDDKLRLEMSLSQTECYIGQPITMTITWYIHSSIVRRIGYFDFNIPALGNSDDFITEDVQVPPGGGGELIRLKLPSGEIIARQKQMKGDFLGLIFGKILIPRHAGEIELVPPRLICKVVEQSQRSRRDPWGGFFSDDVFGRREYKRFAAQAKGATLKVRPLPQKGRPADFNGLVGRYTISTSAQPVKVNVGDPITLTITISGELLKQVQMPDLQSMAENFKIASEQSTPKTQGNQKIFTQTIRAKNERIKEIPGIPLSYFDVEKGRYITIFSEPISLKVAATENVTARQAEGWNLTKPTSEIEAVRGGIAANVYDQSELLTDAAFSPMIALVQPGYVALWAGPLVLFAVLSLVRRLTNDSPERRQARRRSSASRRTVSRLAKINSRSASAPQEMADIMRQYVGDRFNRTAASLTARDCRKILQNVCHEKEPVERFCRVLEQCEQSQFAGTNADDSIVEPADVRKLVKTLDKILK